jgi:3',5'-cyclic AMP phosphodiesterase CpdA
MRTLVHLSDLHFGRIDERLIAPLTHTISALDADLLVVSGDLTQRARRGQFRAARQFLDTLALPRIVVPGNHDVPLYNVFKRFAGPLDNYRRYIAENVEPEFVDAEIAVIGVNTARSLTFKNGRINAVQMARIRDRLLPLPAPLVRIVVTHHPFDLPPRLAGNELVGRAGLAMQAFADSGVDLLLAGHVHASHSANSSERYPIDGYAALVIQAGTATSTRRRGESNSFNVLRIDAPRVSVERWSWNEQRAAFVLAESAEFFRSSGPNGNKATRAHWRGVPLK